MKLRLEHAEWQAGLGRVAEYARKAVKEVGRGEEGWVRENRALREENRVLRGLVGGEEGGGFFFRLLFLGFFKDLLAKEGGGASA